MWRKPVWITGHHEATNICIMGVPEGEEKERERAEILFKKFQNLGRNMHI